MRNELKTSCRRRKSVCVRNQLILPFVDYHFLTFLFLFLFLFVLEFVTIIFKLQLKHIRCIRYINQHIYPPFTTIHGYIALECQPFWKLNAINEMPSTSLPPTSSSSSPPPHFFTWNICTIGLILATLCVTNGKYFCYINQYFFSIHCTSAKNHFRLQIIWLFCAVDGVPIETRNTSHIWARTHIDSNLDSFISWNSCEVIKYILYSNAKWMAQWHLIG